MDYSANLIFAIYGLVILAVVGLFALAAVQRLVMPVLSNPAFTVKGLVLDILGAVILVGGGIDLLHIVFGSTGWTGLLEMIVLYTLSTLGLFGVIIAVMISLALRFCLRIAMLLMPKRAAL